MGFSTVISFSIVLISFLAVAGIVVSVGVEKFKEVSEVYQQERREFLEEFKTNFEITEIRTTIVGDNNHTLEIVLTNSGSVTLNSHEFTILVDGKICGYTVNKTKLFPLTSVLITVSNLPGGENSEHRLKVVSKNGTSRYASYKVG